MADSPRALLEVRGLKKQFGPHEVLRGIDLHLPRASVFCIIGPNGCGKSTLLRCLNLLETYQDGEVHLGGRLVSQGGMAARGDQARHARQRIGMVSQQFNLFPHMNVLHNVMCGPLHVLKKTKAEAAALAEKMLKKVGLWEKHASHPATLSGGQQQRVAIARALAVGPEVMLFDEATSALDPVLTQEVSRVVRDLAKGDGMTMLLVTHDLDFARDISDEVVFMEQGRISVQGSPNYIFDQRPTTSLQAFLKPA